MMLGPWLIALDERMTRGPGFRRRFTNGEIVDRDTIIAAGRRIG